MRVLRKTAGPVLLLAVLALLASPMALAWVRFGGNLPVATTGNGYQRDFRVFNDFQDATANDNNNSNSNYPGTTGAILALWKAAHGWASDNNLAAKNFDYDYQGEAFDPGTNNSNVVSASDPGLCDNNTLAYVINDGSVDNGWTMRFCDDRWVWDDGPGNPGGNRMDIQGVAVHEFGHALGLDHTQASNCTGGCSGRATMCPTTCDNGFLQRTINADDQDGLRAIYGNIPANKPLITGLSGELKQNGILTITGTDFGLNPVHVKFTGGSSEDTGDIPGVVKDVPTLAGGTQVDVQIPVDAFTGNVFIWRYSNLRLSNYFPIEIEAYGPECHGILYGEGTPGQFGLPIIEMANGPSYLGNPDLQIRGTNLYKGGVTAYLLVSLTSADLTLGSATKLHVGFPLAALIAFVTEGLPIPGQGKKTIPYPLPDDPALAGITLYNQFLVTDDTGPDGLTSSQGLAIEICDL